MMNVETKHMFDMGAIGVAFAGFLGYLPSVATALSIVYLGLQIYTYFINKKWKKQP